MPSTSENDERLMAAVFAALEKPLSERADFLRLACGANPKLLREASEIVAKTQKMGSFLLHPMIAIKVHSPPFQPGDVVSERFEIIRQIGEGGMGIVYEAFDRKRGLRIAMKAAKPGFQRLLSPELEGALNVRHPNVCRVNEIHTAQTRHGAIDFLTMELLDGETLSSYLKARPNLSETEALPIARQLCSGLAEAHRSGVIHRDLKSANVILCRSANSEPRAVITDFGLSGAPTKEHDFAGTPEYMAPELRRGENSSKASDIYSLGVVLYELVRGRCPHNLGEVGSLPPDTRGLSKTWSQTVTRCLAPSPASRPKDAGDILARLVRPPSPWRFLAVLPLLALLALCFPQVRTEIHDRLWPPPNVRLAILPPAASGASLALANRALHDVSHRLSCLKSGSRLVAVISARQTADALKAHATHTLETTFKPDRDAVQVTVSLLDLKNQTRIREFSGRYSPAIQAAIPDAIAGTVSASLGLQGNFPSDALSPAATKSYNQGLQILQKDDNGQETAIPFLQEAARLAPRSPLPLTSLVEVELRLHNHIPDPNRLLQAKMHLHSAESLNPDSVSVHYASGRLHETTGEYEKARSEYLRASELEPKKTTALLALGRMYDRLEMPDKAMETYRAAMALGPADYKPYQQLGLLYYDHGKYAEAAEQFKKAIQLAQHEKLALYVPLASTLESLGKFHEAEQTLRTSLKIRESPGSLCEMGNVLAVQHRDAEAASYYKRALAINHQAYIILLDLVEANSRLGRVGIARSQSRRGMDLALAHLRENPRAAEPRAFVACFAAHLGLKQRAADEIEQALQLTPANSSVTELAAATYETLGMRNKALSVLRRATSQLLHDLSADPDLAKLFEDPRVKQLMAAANKEAK